VVIVQLQELIHRILKICEDPRYEEKKELWKQFNEGREIGRPLVTVFSRSHDWARELGFDLLRYYSDPKYYLEMNLRIMLYKHKYIFDDSYLTPSISIEFAGAFEPSLMGVDVVFHPCSTPWPGKPIVKDKKDVERLSYPDIYESGLMPKIHEFHDTISNIVGEDFNVSYPSWTRGPWGVVVHMLGWYNALLNLLKNRMLLERLLDFVTEARMVWEKDWGDFIGKKTLVSALYNDEVDSKTLSPKNYRELILPREQRLADFYKEGISYFHSCGNITPFLEDIKKIRGLKMIEISGWTDMKTAIKVFEPHVTLQRWIRLEVFLLREEEMRARLRRILEEDSGRRMVIVNGGAVRDTIRWLRAVKPIINSPKS
jgi:uroporphyrinogen-III decarboxylase